MKDNINHKITSLGKKRQRDNTKTRISSNIQETIEVDLASELEKEFNKKNNALYERGRSISMSKINAHKPEISRNKSKSKSKTQSKKSKSKGIMIINLEEEEIDIDEFGGIENPNVRPFKGENIDGKKPEEDIVNIVTPVIDEHEDFQRNYSVENDYCIELSSFCKKLQPKGQEPDKRKEYTWVIFNFLISRIYGNLKSKIFGSYKQDLWTMMSDIDLVLIPPKNTRLNKLTKKKKLEVLLQKLNDSKFGIKMQIIGTKAPIIKGYCNYTNTWFDISINDNKTVETSEIICNIIQNNPILKSVNLIMKVLLKYNNLIGANRGYMSSYLLFHIIYAVYIQYREECCDNDKGNVYYL